MISFVPVVWLQQKKDFSGNDKIIPFFNSTEVGDKRSKGLKQDCFSIKMEDVSRTVLYRYIELHVISIAV